MQTYDGEASTCKKCQIDFMCSAPINDKTEGKIDQDVIPLLDENTQDVDGEIEEIELLTGFLIIEERKGYKFVHILISVLCSAYDTYKSSARGVRLQTIFLRRGYLLDSCSSCSQNYYSTNS